MNWKIPLFDLDIGEEEKNAVLDVLSNGWLTMGRRTAEFESLFREKTGARHAYAVASGTAALHLACSTAGFKKGDEVICPGLTFVATAHAIRYTGARAVFTESRGSTDLNIDPGDIEQKISERTKGVLILHYAGFPCDMAEITTVCKRHGLVLIEDCAHSLFSSYRGEKMCGRYGLCGCFSFFSNKNMTTGEGGMIITDDDDAAESIRLMRSHGMTSLTMDRHEGRAVGYDVVTPGYNYRIDEMRAALGMAQLRKLDERLARRREVYTYYRSRLKNLPVELPFEAQLQRRDTVGIHIFPVLLPRGCKRDQVMAQLRSRGVQTSIHYPPVHFFKEFKNEATRLPVTEDLVERELTLPFYPSLTEKEIDYVVECVAGALKS